MSEDMENVHGSAQTTGDLSRSMRDMVTDMNNQTRELQEKADSFIKQVLAA